MREVRRRHRWWWFCLATLAGHAWGHTVPAQTREPATVPTDYSRLRLPLLLTGLGVEAVAIGTDRLVPYLGLGHHLQREWNTGSALAAGEVGLMVLHARLRSQVGDGDLRLHPPRTPTPCSVAAPDSRPHGMPCFAVQTLSTTRHTTFG